MIKTVEYKEDGSIEIDNSELLSKRADISLEHKDPDTFKGEKNGLGGISGTEEDKLKNDKRNRWHEPKTSMEVLHVCPVCNTKFMGRTNRVYCSPKCKETDKKRRQRQRAKDIKNFKPYRGKTGEVYFKAKGYGKYNTDIIVFIPAISAENRTKAREYIKTNYSQLNNSPNNIKGYIAQVNTVILK